MKNKSRNKVSLTDKYSDLMIENLFQTLTLSWWRCLSYRNQSIYLLCKSIDWFLYDRNLRHERVNLLCYIYPAIIYLLKVNNRNTHEVMKYVQS